MNPSAHKFDAALHLHVSVYRSFPYCMNNVAHGMGMAYKAYVWRYTNNNYTFE